MFSNLIPNISRHFMYSLLEHDYQSGSEIISTIFRLPPEQIAEFLLSLSGGLDGLFYRFEVDLCDYHKVKDEAIESMKKPIEEDMEEFY